MSPNLFYIQNEELFSFYFNFLIYKIDIIVLKVLEAIKRPNHRKCQDGQLVAIEYITAAIILQYLLLYKD